MSIVNTITTWLSNVLQAVILLLPDSPFIYLESTAIPKEISDILPLLNWLFGVSTLVYILTMWLGAIIIFYIYQAILRWVKAIA